ncbi:hypothetical protein HYN48_14165 [Flavobacterium magnum]|uniref:Uncharacterized protein n=1 Tax=Flavobacterium magnum TaxID=2162713 RepID=A0A2S0RHQ1_9FLAO|nr:hypothetical protein [Flavobacterium magnum]AWA31145.1 hypothetical protein HYN48_14165 [Flavobacterium magnum]
MENELIQQAILKRKIQLSTSEKLTYYRSVFFLMTVTALCFFDFFRNTKLDLNDSSLKWGLTLFIFSVIVFVNQNSKLKLKSIAAKNCIDNLSEKITEIARLNNWKIEFSNRNTFILTNSRPFSSGRYTFSKSMGEKIYIFKESNEILFRSIYDMEQNNGIVIGGGENQENERKIKACC